MIVNSYYLFSCELNSPLLSRNSMVVGSQVRFGEHNAWDRTVKIIRGSCVILGVMKEATKFLFILFLKGWIMLGFE